MSKLHCVFLLFLLTLLIVACRPIASTPTKDTGLDYFETEVHRLNDMAERRAQACCTAPLAVFALWVAIVYHHSHKGGSRLFSGSIREGIADQKNKIGNGTLGRYTPSEQHILMVARLALVLSLFCVVVLWRPLHFWPVFYQRLFYFFEIWGALIIFEIGIIAWIEASCFGLLGFIQSQRPYTQHLAKAQLTLLIAATMMIFAAISELSPWVHVESRLIHGKRYNLAARNEWLDETGTTYVLFECDVSSTFCSYICTSPYIAWSYATLSGGLEYEPSTNELWIQGMFRSNVYCRYQPSEDQSGYSPTEAR